MVDTLACNAVLIAGGEERKQKRKSSRSGNSNRCELLWIECLDKRNTTQLLIIKKRKLSRD